MLYKMELVYIGIVLHDFVILEEVNVFYLFPSFCVHFFFGELLLFMYYLVLLE